MKKMFFSSLMYRMINIDVLNALSSYIPIYNRVTEVGIPIFVYNAWVSFFSHMLCIGISFNVMLPFDV